MLKCLILKYLSQDQYVEKKASNLWKMADKLKFSTSFHTSFKTWWNQILSFWTSENDYFISPGSLSNCRQTILLDSNQVRPSPPSFSRSELTSISFFICHVLLYWNKPLWILSEHHFRGKSKISRLISQKYQLLFHNGGSNGVRKEFLFFLRNFNLHTIFAKNIFLFIPYINYKWNTNNTRLASKSGGGVSFRG